MLYPKPKKRKKKSRGHRFSYKVKQKITERDQGCIIPHCTNPPVTHHHVYWHTSERIHDFEKANTADKGVYICGKCHADIHAGDLEKDKFCHTYLYNLNQSV